MKKFEDYDKFPVVMNALDGLTDQQKSTIIHLVKKHSEDDLMHEHLYSIVIGAFRMIAEEEIEKFESLLSYIPDGSKGFVRATMIRHLALVDSSNRETFATELSKVFNGMQERVLPSEVSVLFIHLNDTEMRERASELIGAEYETYCSVLTKLNMHLIGLPVDSCE